jgi:hypothetical protein
VTTFRLGASLPRIDATVRAGQALELSIPVLDDVQAVVPAAELASARAQVRATPTGDVLYEFSTDTSGATITTDGLVVLSATGEQTAEWVTSWPAAGAWWDLEVTDIGGSAHPLTAPGRLVILPRITR